MKRLLIILTMLMLARAAPAQQKANLTASGTTCTAGVSTACLSVSVDPPQGGATFTLSGTFSATIQFEASGDGGSTWVALNVTPSNSTTAVTSATAAGTWQANIAGYTNVRERVSAFTSGPVVASIVGSTASARTGGGGGGGAVSSVFTRTGAVTATTGDYTCTQVTGCPASSDVFVATTSCAGISAATCVQWTDDDSTNNCGAATTAWVAAINGYAGLGIPQVLITGSGNGKAYLFNSCNFVFSNNLGVTITLQATIDCAMATQSCIQFGATRATGSSETFGGLVPPTYRIGGGGTLIGGTSLTGTGGNGSLEGGGIYVMPQAAQAYINDLNFKGSGTQYGFGAIATNGTCTNYSIYFDYAFPTGFVDRVNIEVNSANVVTAGGCGIGNPNGAAGGTNTVMITNSAIYSFGESGGTGQCGSIAINDGGSLSTVSTNNIFGFGIPILLQGLGHKVMLNNLDSTQCAAGGVSAVIQIGSNSTVGPTNISANTLQLGTNHATDFMALVSGATPTLTGFIVTGNNNQVTPGPIFASTPVCTIVSNPCTEFANTGVTLPDNPCGAAHSGWQINDLVASCYTSGNTADIGNQTMYSLPAGSSPANFLASCQVILTQAATTSSTLPTCRIVWTDGSTSVVQTAIITSTWASGAPGCFGTTTNTVGNTCQGSIYINPAASTNVQYYTGGTASVGATPMQYALNPSLTRQ